MIMKRKGDYDDDHGGWGKGKVTGKGFRGAKRGKTLKPGTYGEAAGRTFAVLEVGGTRPILFWLLNAGYLFYPSDNLVVDSDL